MDDLDRILASPSYLKAFEDHDFLKRDEMRAVRLELELLKPEIIQRENGIQSTVVVFGSARIPDPERAARRLDKVREEAGADPENPELKRQLHLAERMAANARYYEQAREFARIVSVANQIRPPGRVRRRHRRRPRNHGGRQPRRPRHRREERGAEHRASLRAGAEPLHHARAVLPVPLLRHPQDALPDAGARRWSPFPAATEPSTNCSRR